MQRFFKHRLWLVVACLMIAAGGAPAHAQAPKPQTPKHPAPQPFVIPAQPLPKALMTFARLTHVSLLLADGCRQARSRAVVGDLTPRQALHRMLAYTGCIYLYCDRVTLAVLPVTGGRLPKVSRQGAPHQ